MQIPSLPFRILALAPFGPVPDSGFNPRPMTVDLASIDPVMTELGPRFYLPVPKELCPDGGLTLEIKSLKGFKPIELIKNNTYLKAVSQAAKFIEDALRSNTPQQSIVNRIKTDWPDLPLNLDLPAAAPKEKNEAVDDILALVTMPDSPVPSAAERKRSRDLKGQVDDLLSALVSFIFNHEEFRTYEAAWRGLETLLKKGPVKEGRDIHLTLVPVSFNSLPGVLDKLVPSLVLEPPHLVLIDLALDNTTPSIELMEKMAEFAETLLAPTVGWITPGFFYLNDWSELKKLAYLKHQLEDSAHAKWRKLKEQSGANWLAVTLNRFLTRFPYGPEHKAKGVTFTEDRPLWLSPVWALGVLAVQSHLAYGWPTRFTDYHNLMVPDLPLEDFSGEGPSVTEMIVSEDRLLEFVEVGLTPLMGPYRKDFAIMPHEATLSGVSLKFQLFFSRILGFLFWCKDNLDEKALRPDLGAGLTAAFSRYWEKTGHPPPEDLQISAGQPQGPGGVPLSISLTPPVTVLPGGRRLEFSFAW